MTTKTKIDPEIPATAPSDWVGARKVLPGVAPRAVKGGLTFHVFRASTDHRLFLVADRAAVSAPPPATGGTWQKLKTLRETGQPRIGFSEAEAKRDIVRKGYHLCRVGIRTSERPAGRKAASRSRKTG
jgi:hypothetical protein